MVLGLQQARLGKRMVIHSMVIQIMAAVLSGLVCASAAAQSTAPGKMTFREYSVIDSQQGGLTAATFLVPEQWTVTSRVVWTYADVSHPIRIAARAQSPDGSAWVEFFPMEVYYWLEPVLQPVARGSRSLGMIFAPGIDIKQAVQNQLLSPYRSKLPNLQIVSQRELDPIRMAQAFNTPAAGNGQALSVRLRYTVNGRPAEEDIYAMLGSGNRIPYRGPQGTTYESHRPLWFAHAMGATDGNLRSMYPLLSYIATSVKPDPMWQQRRQQVEQAMAEQFNRNLAAGYARIAAAGAMSKAISANNDAMLAGMQATRRAQNQRDAARKVAGAGSAGSPTDGFDRYIRGTEKYKDPYWGETERSSSEGHHWTDGQGGYRSSNDPGFDPNRGAGSGPTWRRMEPAR